MNIDAEIALKNAEMDKLRLELEKLEAKKNEIMKAERIEQEQKRANTQRSEFEKNIRRTEKRYDNRTTSWNRSFGKP